TASGILKGCLAMILRLLCFLVVMPNNKTLYYFSIMVETGVSFFFAMALYFNVFFFPIWLITILLMLHLKYECLSHIYRFIVVAVLIAIFGIEIIRLYMGYLGNLTEKIPELAGFWMLSLLLQFPLQLFLFVNEETKPFPIERAVQGIMLSFLIVQLVSGFFALKNASRHQANRFHVMQFQATSHLELLYKMD
ncbi:hypothetical protein L9F63_016320, partial [Diploptera punctata]